MKFRLALISLIFACSTAHADIKAYVGSFNSPGSTGNQTYTGIVDADGNAFTPKAIIFLSVRGTAFPVLATSAIGSFGMTTDSESASICISDTNGVSPSDTRSRHTNNQCFSAINTAGTTVDTASLVSIGSGQFTINWSVSPIASVPVYYMAIGGDDLENVYIKEFTTKTSTGDQAVTGVGFKPDGIIFISNQLTNAPPATANHSFWMIGFCDSYRNQAATSAASEDNVATGNGERWSLSGKSVLMTDYSGNQLKSASIKSFDSDGFTLNYDVANASAYYVWALCFKGGTFELQSATELASIGVINTPISTYARGAFLISDLDPTNSLIPTNLLRTSFGMMAGSSEIGMGLVGGNDNPTQTARTLQTTIVANPDKGATSIVTQANVDAFDYTKFDLDFTIVQGAGRQYYTLIMGDTAYRFPKMIGDGA